MEQDLVETRVGAAGEETVEFYKQEEVRVLTLGSSPRTLLDVVAGDVDTHLAVLLIAPDLSQATRR